MSKGKRNLPKISIVIPSYNKVDFIEETFLSIVSQNYPKLELIIQDGGSTDGTVNIINKYAQKYPDIIFWESKKDKGQVDAINKGLEKASGEIVTYINADDVYEKGTLRAIGDYFAKNPKTLWLAGRGMVINSKGKEISGWVTAYKNFLLTLNLYYLLLITNYLIQPSVFLSRKAITKFGPFKGTKNFVLEYDLWLKLGQVQMPAILSLPLASFRLFKENISSTQYRNVLEKDYLVVKKYTRNPIILLLHKINNLGRIVNILLIKKRW